MELCRCDALLYAFSLCKSLVPGSGMSPVGWKIMSATVFIDTDVNVHPADVEVVANLAAAVPRAGLDVQGQVSKDTSTDS